MSMLSYGGEKDTKHTLWWGCQAWHTSNMSGHHWSYGKHESLTAALRLNYILLYAICISWILKKLYLCIINKHTEMYTLNDKMQYRRLKLNVIISQGEPNSTKLSVISRGKIQTINSYSGLQLKQTHFILIVMKYNLKKTSRK